MECLESAHSVTQLFDGGPRLGHMHQARSRNEVDIEAAAGPGKQCIPRFLLALDERARPLRAIAGKIGFGVIGEALGEGVPVGDDTVDRCVSESCERHRPRVDRLADGTPFFGDGFGECAGRNGQWRARRCLNRSTVKPDFPALAFLLDVDVFPEPLHELRRSFSSHAFLSRRGANMASRTPRMATIAPICGHPPGRKTLVYMIAIPNRKIARP